VANEVLMSFFATYGSRQCFDEDIILQTFLVIFQNMWLYDFTHSKSKLVSLIVCVQAVY